MGSYNKMYTQNVNVNIIVFYITDVAAEAGNGIQNHSHFAPSTLT